MLAFPISPASASCRLASVIASPSAGSPAARSVIAVLFWRLQIGCAVVLVECGSSILPLHRNKLRPGLPMGSAYARSANESTDGSATEIAPCRLSLVVGVEFPKDRFDGVRVGPCFFVEDEFLVRSPDHHSVLTATPLYPRRASSSLTNLQSSTASGAAPSTVTVTIPSNKDTSTSRQSRSPQFTAPPISDRFSTASASISSTAAWSAMASSLVIFRKTSCAWFVAEQAPSGP